MKIIKLLFWLIIFSLSFSCKKKLSNGQSYPSINDFGTSPSNKFLVDFKHIDGGHPYKGSTAIDPHKGAHVHFDNSDSTYKNSFSPEQYPAIYAVSDGEILRVDEYYQIQSNTNTHYKYDIELLIAQDGLKKSTFSYSIEPMIDPGNSDFYKPFILIKKGDLVEKGQIIAYMYLDEGEGIGAHIHFHLNKDGEHMAPAIFTPELVDSFHSKWGVFKNDKDYSTGIYDSIPPCMGYKVSENENPFNTGFQELL